MQTLLSASVLVGNLAGFSLFVLMYRANRYYTWPAVPEWSPDMRARHRLMGWMLLIVALDAVLSCGAGCTGAIFRIDGTLEITVLVLCYSQFVVVPVLWHFAMRAARRMWA